MRGGDLARVLLFICTLSDYCNGEVSEAVLLLLEGRPCGHPSEENQDEQCKKEEDA